ncbi:hypothetical protein C8J57DRAFT_1609898 [Mycena rebaudengoi]|nr:hypothetical protein C8J57DRAFT_1609898 [Mycena rebaudengoi]
MRAAAWAQAEPGQALIAGSGSGLRFLKPKPCQAGPKPRLSGRAGPWASLRIYSPRIMGLSAACLSQLKHSLAPAPRSLPLLLSPAVAPAPRSPLPAPRPLALPSTRHVSQSFTRMTAKFSDRSRYVRPPALEVARLGVAGAELCPPQQLQPPSPRHANITK